MEFILMDLGSIFFIEYTSDLNDDIIVSNIYLIFIGDILIEENIDLDEDSYIFFGFDFIIDDIINDIEMNYLVIFNKDRFDIRDSGMIIVRIKDWKFLIREDFRYYTSLIYI
jgi:hypothetical protein